MRTRGASRQTPGAMLSGYTGLGWWGGRGRALLPSSQTRNPLSFWITERMTQVDLALMVGNDQQHTEHCSTLLKKSVTMNSVDKNIPKL